MKIRILDNAIRLRLDRTEVNAVGAGQAVRATTQFPSGESFGYSLTSGDVALPDADFRGGVITVTLPTEVARAWATDETQVGVSANPPVGDDALSLLIEKDFECLDPREGENQNNRFVNPKAGS